MSNSTSIILSFLLMSGYLICARMIFDLSNLIVWKFYIHKSHTRIDMHLNLINFIVDSSLY